MDEIRYRRRQKLACCFDISFSADVLVYCGRPLVRNFRRRRMTAAAFVLQQSDAKVIILRCATDMSPPPLSSRMSSVHGVTPPPRKKKASCSTPICHCLLFQSEEIRKWITGSRKGICSNRWFQLPLAKVIEKNFKESRCSGRRCPLQGK